MVRIHVQQIDDALQEKAIVSCLVSLTVTKRNPSRVVAVYPNLRPTYACCCIREA